MKGVTCGRSQTGICDHDIKYCFECPVVVHNVYRAEINRLRDVLKMIDQDVELYGTPASLLAGAALRIGEEYE